jgi:hypothetical protein
MSRSKESESRATTQVAVRKMIDALKLSAFQVPLHHCCAPTPLTIVRVQEDCQGSDLMTLGKLPEASVVVSTGTSISVEHRQKDTKP